MHCTPCADVAPSSLPTITPPPPPNPTPIPLFTRVLDAVTIDDVSPVPQYVAPTSVVGSSVNFIPTTAAQSWTFFKLSVVNARSKSDRFGLVTFPLNACLAPATYQRCTNADCTTLSRDAVPQQVYAWDSQLQFWNEIGPGATGPSNTPSSYKPIIANGVRALAHFSPDNVQDYIVPASFDEDVKPSITNPTEQCGTVWRYLGSTLLVSRGYERYQDCVWKGQGTRHVTTFTIQGETYLLHTSMVDRRYSGLTLVSEQFRGLPNFLLKWSSRLTDNRGVFRPFGHFLSGGEGLPPGQVLQSSDPGYNAAVGNNGSNVFQVRQRRDVAPCRVHI